MRLGDFIEQNLEPILQEWDRFAHSIVSGMTTLALRDHANEILLGAVRDMQTDQNEAQRSTKSQGGAAPDNSSRFNSASHSHGVDRLASGFDLMELFSEYRALRATVLRLWAESVPSANQSDIDDITRFNESIDQSLGRALQSFTQKVDHSRDMFLAILSHDLRNPLTSIAMSAQAMPRLCKLDAEALKFSSQISTSAKVMDKLICDVLDFTRTRLGGGLPIRCELMDLTGLVQEVVSEFCAGHPERTISVDAAAGLTGEWDKDRLRQVISNLLGNALQHGDSKMPVVIVLTGDAETVSFKITNGGTIRTTENLSSIFDPLIRGVHGEANGQGRAGSIGLGLYIARELVVGHRGTIDATSAPATGTSFTFKLPRAKLVHSP